MWSLEPLVASDAPLHYKFDLKLTECGLTIWYITFNIL